MESIINQLDCISVSNMTCHICICMGCQELFVSVLSEFEFALTHLAFGGVITHLHAVLDNSMNANIARILS